MTLEVHFLFYLIDMFLDCLINHVLTLLNPTTLPYILFQPFYNTKL